MNYTSLSGHESITFQCYLFIINPLSLYINLYNLYLKSTYYADLKEQSGEITTFRGCALLKPPVILRLLPLSLFVKHIISTFGDFNPFIFELGSMLSSSTMTFRSP